MQAESDEHRITPSHRLRVNEMGSFRLDLVLQGNQTSLDHPDGIYHPLRISTAIKENISDWGHGIGYLAYAEDGEASNSLSVGEDVLS